MDRPPRILLIDDDEQLRLLASDLIKEELPAAQIDAITSLPALDAAIETTRYCLVITDYHLGWSDGLTVLRRVKARQPDCPVIMFTGTGSEEIAVEAMKSGLDDYVLKSPKHVGRLAPSVRQALERADERRRLREHESRTHSLLNDVLDSSATGVIILDAAFEVIWVNTAIERMFGLDRKDMLKVDKRELIRSRIKPIFEDPDEFERRVLLNYENRLHVEEFECHVLPGDGRLERWLEHRSQPITVGPFAGGRIEHYYDVTGRKRAEQTLRATHDMLETLIQASPLGIVMLDTDGLVQLWNPACERLSGWTAGEVVGRRLPIVPHGHEAEFSDLLRRNASGESFRNLELVRQKKDGTPITVLLSTTPFKDADGRITGVIGMLVDVTERKHMQAQAGRLERMSALGQLLGGIAHGLKNPLFVVTGYLQLVREKIGAHEYDSLPGDLDKVEEAASRITRALAHFQEMARPSQPRQEPCSVNAVLEKALDLSANELMMHNIAVETRYAADLPSVWGDSRLLQEAFLNLIINAMQAMKTAHGKGTLTVSTSLTGGPQETPHERRVEVRIQDNGPGIPEEHRSKLFEPFFSTKPAEEGTGMGLWTVRSIVMSMHGRVAFETEVGRGSTFLISLPVFPTAPSLS